MAILADSERTEAYTEGSFRRQTKLLRKELSNLGVQISSDEAARISFLSRRKYDRYDHFYPGETFDSRLLKWLEMNFEKGDRQMAMEVVKSLKFISNYELKDYAIKTFENVKSIISSSMGGISTSSWYNYIESKNLRFEEELARSIFVACVDDINFSFFRRYAMRLHPFLKKDNFVEYYKRDKGSLEELPEHNRIFLLDQLSGSATTAIRQRDGKWEGKIPTFEKIWKDYLNDASVFYCPYILSLVAEMNLDDRLKLYLQENDGLNISVAATHKIPISPCLKNEQGTDIDESKPVAKLCKKYYSRFVEDTHIEIAGSACYGYGRAGLTLVLQPNCPNNTVYILWHSFNDWYPLFPRVSHHR